MTVLPLAASGESAMASCLACTFWSLENSQPNSRMVSRGAGAGAGRMNGSCEKESTLRAS